LSAHQIPFAGVADSCTALALDGSNKGHGLNAVMPSTINRDGQTSMVSTFPYTRNDQIDHLCSVLEAALDHCEALGLELVAARVASALDALQTDWDLVSQLSAMGTPEQYC
jgi:hypothetical protein